MILLPPTDPVLNAFSPAARAVLAKPDRVTVYAVDTSPFAKKPKLGFADATSSRPLSAKEGKEAVGALYAVLRSVKPGVDLACFDPHHGLMATRGKRWVKVWICFICRQTEIEESGGRHVTVPSGLGAKSMWDRLVPQAAPPSRRRPGV